MASGPILWKSSRSRSRWCGQASTVTGTPLRLAAATSRTTSGTDACTTCRAAPVVAAQCRTRATASTSWCPGRDSAQDKGSRRPRDRSSSARYKVTNSFSACTANRLLRARTWRIPANTRSSSTRGKIGTGHQERLEADHPFGAEALQVSQIVVDQPAPQGIVHYGLGRALLSACVAVERSPRSAGMNSAACRPQW